MAEKKSKKESVFRKFLEAEFLSALVKNMRKAIDSSVKNIKKSVEDTVEYSIKKVTAFFMMFIGSIFLLVGIGIIIEKYLSLPEGAGFAVLGLIIAFTGLIFSALIKR